MSSTNEAPAKRIVSLSRLLFVSHASLAAITIAGFAAVMFVMSYHATYRQAEGELLGAAELLVQDLRNDVSPVELTLPDSFFHRFGKAPRDQAYWVLWGSDESEVARDGDVPDGTMMSDRPPNSRGPQRFRTERFGRHLQLFVSTDDGGQLMIGRPLAKEFDSLVRLAVRLVLIGLLGIGLAGAIAWWLAKRIAQPIIAFTNTANSITHERLEERLPIPQPTREMDQLAVSFNGMLTELKAAFDRQQQFTADAAHELRTPVAIILSQSEFSLSKERSSSDYRDALTTCRDTAAHMKRLVNDLLAISQAEFRGGEMAFEPVDLAMIVSDAVQMIASPARDREIHIETDLVASPIAGHRTSLLQIVFNLLSNAIRYNTRGGSVRVVVKPDGAMTRLSVADTGVGIHPTDLPFVWDRFYRVDQVRTLGGETENGSGLGLSLVAELVRRHGGEVTIDSTPDQGTTVEAVFPSLEPEK